MQPHALTSGVLVGVLLGNLGRMFHLQYTDDLVLTMTRVLEDQRILKLILLLFEGLSRLIVNFFKSYMYSTTMWKTPREVESLSLSYAAGLLSMTYLRVPISGKSPRQQD